MFLNGFANICRSRSSGRVLAGSVIALYLSVAARQAWALEILVNQVGFEPNAPKCFRVQRATDDAGDGVFTVRRAPDNTIVYSGTLARKGPLWNRFYWEGNFSAWQVPGDYFIQATIGSETNNSYGFSIGNNTVLQQTGVLVYQYFYTQRCGAAVTGWHPACHLDDGIRKDNNQHWDAAGGWHDAGDYNKFPHGFAGDALFQLLWLYDSDRAWFDAIDTNANGIADALDEALHQARWLAKMVEPTGHVLKETQKRRLGASWVRPEADTNNVIGDYDDRWINPGDEATPQEIVVCAALVRMHRILASKGLPTENFRDKALSIWNHRVALAVAEGGHNNLGQATSHVMAGLDLYAELGLPDCYNRAVQKVGESADYLLGNPAAYDSIGYAESVGYELGMLAWFARNYPSLPQAVTARNAVAAVMAHNLDLADDPVGLIRRNEGGTLQYFPTDPDWNAFFLGLNRLYLNLTWGAIEAYKLTGDVAYLRFAIDQYSWVAGANCDNVCMMEGAGDHNLARYHTRLDTISGHSDGAQPGVVPNGYVRVYLSGLPNIDLTGNRYQSNEGWLINNGSYCMALSAMTVFRDAARSVLASIPAEMEAGRTYPVSITVQNTSWIPWTNASAFRLGAVDDSDPFATGRQDLPVGITVAPGASYTWTFNMTAPTGLGTYTTDWRMVHENVNWFGDSLVRQVQVVPRRYPGDFDSDSDVDQEDFGHIQRCLDDSGLPPPAGCLDADLDADQDVDVADLHVFFECFNGPGRLPGC